MATTTCEPRPETTFNEAPETTPEDVPRPDDVAPEGPRRPARRRGHDRKGTGHGMLNAGSVRNRWAVAWRHIKVKLLSKLPGTRFKSRLVRKWLGEPAKKTRYRYEKRPELLLVILPPGERDPTRAGSAEGERARRRSRRWPRGATRYCIPGMPRLW